MKRSLFWFRKNLRLQDNSALIDCLDQSDDIILLWIYDQRWNEGDPLGFPRMGKYRKKFLTESVINLQENLSSLNLPLYITSGRPADVIKKIVDQHSIQAVYAQQEHCSYEKEQELEVKQSVPLHLSEDHTLYTESDLPFDLDRLPSVFTAFRKKVEKYSQVRPPLQKKNLHHSLKKYTQRQKLIPAEQKIKLHYGTSLTLRHQLQKDIEDLEIHLGSAYPFGGGEDGAWNRLHYYFGESRKLSSYKETRNGMLGTDYSSKLSGFLALGNISARALYHEIKKYEENYGSNRSTYWLFFELLWREYFQWVAKKYGEKIFLPGGIQDKTLETRGNTDIFKKWIEGRTAQRFIDANMKELAQTGYMSNRGRQNVASYLVHALGLKWTWGARYFESQLIDYDPASNWCNWMYNAGVGNDTRNRVFNPDRQAERYDPAGAYRDYWLSSSHDL